MLLLGERSNRMTVVEWRCLITKLTKLTISRTAKIKCKLESEKKLNIGGDITP